MSARKLQIEFDKTNKKISEGLTVFDDIYEKLMSSDISSQKEKLESDLKKEIKKLQRLRDQLKQWLGDSSIKLDKNLLQDNRTKIEHAMDQFKDLEKSSKIKQFSNEGLELQSQRSRSKFNDPEDAKKNESCNYISDVIDQLNQQNEALEVELHQLSLQMKKAKTSNAYQFQNSIDDAKYKVERNATHLTKLEMILRSLENEKLDPELVDDIKDDLEYYVENNQEDDYVEYDDFYDQLEIDEELEVHGSLSHISYDVNGNEIEQVDEIEEEQSPIKKVVSNNNLSPTKKKVQSQLPIQTTSTLTQAQAPLSQMISQPPPPPLIGANSYSNIIKAAQASNSPGISNTSIKQIQIPIEKPASSPSSVSSIAASPSLVTPGGAPPGLNQTAKPTTDSSVELPARIYEEEEEDEGQIQSTEEPESRAALPISNDNKGFFDTLSRLSTIPHTRLQNPLPFESISQILESSLLNCPDSFDAEKPRQYSPVNIHPSSIDYPQEPMYELNSSNLMRKFDNDTLFFCFYYSEGIENFAKWNAALELSRRGWVFNNEMKQWFLKDNKNGGKNRSMSVINREEAQDSINGQEEENYKYFDYEKTWLTRRRENYKFSRDLQQTF